jgi:hypothetical protein
MKRSIDAFWPIKKEVSKSRKDKMREALLEAQRKYIEEKKQKDG